MEIRLGPGTDIPGAEELVCSDVGVGTIAWGDASRGYGTTFHRRDIEGAVTYLAEHGVNFFDTAEVYGYKSMQAGESAENLLGICVAQTPARSQPIVSTKFFPVLWTNFLVGGGFRIGKQAVLDALRASITRLGVARVDLYVIHFPFPYIGGMDAIIDGFAEAYNLGLVRAVGASNYTDPAQLRSLHKKFAQRGVPFVSNQVRYNLLDRTAEKSSLLTVCQELGLTVFAYEPLAKGLLTGKFTEPENLESPGRRYTLQQLNFYRPLTSLMKFVGKMEGQGNSRSVTEVALGYVVSKGVVPIVGVKTEGQAREVCRAADPNWRLASEFVEVLNEKTDYLAKQRQ